MWENLQKGLARAQQSGQRYAHIMISKLAYTKTKSMADSVAAEALHHLEEQSEA